MFELSIRATKNIKPVALMRLTQIDDPDDLLKKFDRKDIVVEPKLDGWKIQVIKSDGQVRLYSRRGEEKTKNFPDLINALKSSMPDNSMVEGELVYWDKNKQDVGKVTSIAGSSPENSHNKIKNLPGTIKIHLYDVLWNKGKNISDKPFSERRKILESMIKTNNKIQLTKTYSFSDWQKVINKAVKEGGEGIVLKIKDKSYEYKSKGEQEPKPKDVMFKYKGGGGKEDSDDYVIYDYEMSDKNKLKAKFGQYYKGKLYYISEISNFSKEDEEKIKNKLKSGNFVVEIGFQERVPKGLRHQKFIRFRDDKKPKDATMNEFHVKHIDNFEEANKNDVADRPYIDNTGYVFTADDINISKRATLENEIIKQLEKMVGIKPRRLKSVPGVDVNSLYKIMSYLESGGKTYAIGDAGTSFGPTQVHGPYFLSRLSKMPNVREITGLSSDDLKELSKDWIASKRAVRKADIWKYVPLNQEEVKKFIFNNPESVIKRLEGTFIRLRPDMIAVKRGNRYVGKTLNLETLKKLGINLESPAVRREMEKIFKRYITENVAKSGVAQLIVLSQNPVKFSQFKRKFNKRSIKNNKNLSNLIENVSKQDFMDKVNTVLKCLRESEYDTNAPGAFNIYQLMFIANSSGAGRVCQFLKNKKVFGRGNLHYIQSNRFNKTIKYLIRKNPELSSVGNLLLAGLPPNGGGLSGFKEKRMAFLISKRADGEEFVEEVTKEFGSRENVFYIAIRNYIHHLIINNTQLENLMRSVFDENYRKTFGTFDVVLDRTISDFVRNYTIEEKNVMEILDQYFKKYWNIDLKYEPGEEQKKSEEFWEEAEEEWKEEEPTAKIAISKKAQYTEPGVLYFPGTYSNDIREGKRRMTIRANDVPVKTSEIVKCMTYSGGHICDVIITSKETMSLNRIEKAFGKNIANALERKFGSNGRFVVIRFDKYEDVNFADDDDDESKMSEVLIDKDGVKLTRGQIKKHYTKPSVRKRIMSRIKGNPILIYIGVGKNQNILKRNHNGKQIIITNDDPNKDDDPNNYFYWVKRRLLSIHEVFGPKTNIGFVDLDLHGDFSLDRAKKYAKELVGKIKNKFGVSSTIYQSGGTGLHIEFKFGEEKNINKLRSELKEILDEINESWDNVTTGIVKGSGMRTDISTLHNKGSIRVPGSLGETYGKEKKPILGFQDTDDYPDSMSYGRKYPDIEDNLDENPYSLDTGVIKSLPNLSVMPTDGVGSYNIALSKRDIIKNSIKNPDILKEYIWVWDPNNERLLYHLNIFNGEETNDFHSHIDLAKEYGISLSLDNFRGYIYFFKGEDQGEVHLYSGNPNEMPRKLVKSLTKLIKGEPVEIKKIDVPKGTGPEIWKAKDKERQFEEHMEKRRWMGYKEPDPKFLEMLDLKFASVKKKILILVAPNDFCEPEYTIPRNLFVEKFGFDITTSSSNYQARGNRGTTIQIDKLTNEIDVADYDGFFVVGGKGMVDYSKDKEAQKILKTFIRQKKPIALICHAPLLAVETGVIRGKEVTGWPEIMGKIRRANGKWTGMPVEKDRMLFTAIGPDDSENLAWVFANFLLNKKTLGPAQEKYLSWKNAVKKIRNIWKIAGILDEEIEEGLKNITEEEKKEDPVDAWLKEHDPTYKKEFTPPKEQRKPKELKAPKKTIFEQIEGDIPFEKRKKTVERAKRPRSEFVEEEEIFEEDKDFMKEMMEALSGEPISAEPEQKEEKKHLEIEDAVEKAKIKVNEKLEKRGEKIIKEMSGLSPFELKEYIIDEGKQDEIEKESQEIYVEYTMKEVSKMIGESALMALSPGISPEMFLKNIINKYQNKKETKIKERKNEFTGKNDADISHGEQFAFDDMISMTEEEMSEASPSFTDKIVPFTDKKGNIIDSWPKIKMPELPPEAIKYFEPNKIDNGIGLRKTFRDERAWDVLKKHPDLLQKWILPSVIMAIGYKWFEINSVKEHVGERAEKEHGIVFRHLQGGAPFSMLNDVISPEQIKKLQEGEVEISDLPEAKEYIQHINKLIPKLLNVYLSKEDTFVPIDSYIYSALNNEMIKIIAKKHNFKQTRYPVCSICKMESAPEFALQKMERVGRGKWVCMSCKDKLASVELEISSAEKELRGIDSNMKRIDKDLEKASSRLDPDLPENIKLKEVGLIEKLKSQRKSLVIKKDNIEKEIKDLNKKKYLYEPQTTSVPFFHTLCPNPKCKLRRIPLTAVDWENSIWKTDEGKNYMELLRKEYGIVPLSGMFVEQHADEFSEEEMAEIYHIPKKLRISPSRSWILNIPFKCPYDGIVFKMKDVRGQGYRNMAGFFYSPWETAIWEPQDEKERKKYENDPQYSPENKGPELQELGKINDIAISGALKQYYDFYDYLRHMDVALKSGKKYGDRFNVGKETYTIPRLSKKQRQVFARELALYKTIADFSVGDTQSYLYWLAGSQIVNRPLFIDGKLVRSNVLKKVLKYKDRREQIYLPVLQEWVNNMMKFPDYMNKFNLNEWLVQVGQKQPDGTYSKDGIASDGPGTYFIAKIENDIDDKDHIYGFKCNLQSKRKKDAKYKKNFDSKGPRILRILDVWPLESSDMQRLTSKQKNGEDFVSKIIAEGIINKKERDNLVGDIKSYDFHNVKIDGERSRLGPNNFVLVRAFIIPGKHKLMPLEMIRETQQNKREFEFWEKFAELVRSKADNPEYWKKLKEEVEVKKSMGYGLENIIERELFKIKGKSASFNISKRAKDPLSTYKKKREFDETPEPKEGEESGENKHRFVIQRHNAVKAGEHFDLRLENDDGTMTSWAIPKHKLPKGKEKLLAVKTEDHPVSYMKFEGEIPKGYGAGKVEIYDKGNYKEIEWSKNKIVFKLNGKKEKGTYKIFKTDDNKWMIMENE